MENELPDTSLMIENLNTVYKKHYREKGCECANECSGNVRWGHGCRFYKAKVGKKYGTKGMIKLLFVGKEGTGDRNTLQDCIDEPVVITNVPNNNYHYFGTIYTAVRILSNEKPQSADRKDLLIYDSIQQFFVLTNYFKCSFKNTMNNHHIPVSKAMKEKCPVILLDEIVCLRPDVVVVQGKFTNATFWNGLKGLNKRGCEDSFTCEKTSVTKYCYTDGAPFFVIWSYHPCAPGRKWYKNLDCLEKSIEFVKKKLVHNEE